MRLQRQFNGQQIILDTSHMIGSGGEGRIFPVEGDDSLVAKIYHKLTDEDADKLTVMYNHPPASINAIPGFPSIAWPVDLVRSTDQRRRIVGFLMPRVHQALPIHTFYTPKTRRERKPLFNYLYLHRTARNLAASVADLHASGYVIGDVNESNILVTDTALVTLVDTDSFQVRDPDTEVLYRCPVGKPEFTPPELQGLTFRNLDRTPEQDCFGLAVLIFQLLMEGTHPFSGVYQDRGDPPSIEGRIKSGHFVYGQQRVPYKPMPLAPNFEILSPDLQDLFVQCFEVGHRDSSARPAARDWLVALKQAESALVTCETYSQHRYGDHLDTCPWCDRTAQLNGRDPFPSREAIREGRHLQPIVRKPRRGFKRATVPKSAKAQRSIAKSKYPSSAANSIQFGTIQRKPHRFRRPMIVFPFSLPIRLLSDWAQGMIFGGVWGAVCFSALVAAYYGLDAGRRAPILGGMMMGTVWGGFFGNIATLFLPPTTSLSKPLTLMIGGLWGTFIAAAISGIIFAAIEGLNATQEVIYIGTFLATGVLVSITWGGLWLSLEPPNALPQPAGVRGQAGAVLGSVWGTFLGMVFGGIAIAVLILASLFQGELSLAQATNPLSLVTAFVAAMGLGAIGGASSGTVFGSILGAPILPATVKQTAIRRAMLGGIWGNFLGALAGAGLSLTIAMLFPDLLNIFAANQILPFIIFMAGCGGLWGLVSGSVWGFLGWF
ncbi:MAG: DNA-binding protein [Microcoleaceae cyanobacterium]